MSLRHYYAGDPHWTQARFPSTCKGCGRRIAKGEAIFYFPKGKHVFCKNSACGEYRSAHFEAEAQDEYLYNRGHASEY